LRRALELAPSPKRSYVRTYYVFEPMFVYKITILAAIALAICLSGCRTTSYVAAPATAHEVDAPLPVVSIPVAVKAIFSDNLQQLYIINAANELVKYDADGREAFRYKNTRLGRLEFVDTTDPFNLLAFHPDFGAVVTLGRTLAATGQFQLADLGLNLVPVVALSGDNNLWLYDPDGNRLKKVDRKGKVVMESEDLGLLLELRPSPTYMVERGGQLLLYDPKLGLLLFDIFADYQTKLDIKGAEQLQVVDDVLFFVKDGQLESLELKTLSRKKIALPVMLKEGDLLSLQKGRLFLAQKDVVQVFLIQ
jgi:hypothetical protein